MLPPSFSCVLTVPVVKISRHAPFRFSRIAGDCVGSSFAALRQPDSSASSASTTASPSSCFVAAAVLQSASASAQSAGTGGGATAQRGAAQRVQRVAGECSVSAAALASWSRSRIF